MDANGDRSRRHFKGIYVGRTDEGKPVWRGKYWCSKTYLWKTVCSGYGPIMYLTKEAAEKGAALTYNEKEEALR